MTTSIIRFKEKEIELSSDRLIVWWHTGIRYENKILRNIPDNVIMIYSWKRVGFHPIPYESISAMQEFIRSYDPTMQVIIYNGVPSVPLIRYVTADYWEKIDHDFAIWSWWEVAMWLLRYSKDISTKDIYKTVASLDIFTSKEYDSISLPI